MGNRIYMVAVESVYSKDDPCLGDMYYVLAESEDDAVTHLREQIKKYFFKAKLANKAKMEAHCLGDRVLVYGFVSEQFASSKTELAVTDVTAMAWVYKQANRENWEKFDIELLDAVDA